MTHFTLPFAVIAQFFKFFFSGDNLHIDISQSLLQTKLHNIVTRIKTCSENNIAFNKDISDIMNRLVTGDTMVAGEIQVVEANFNIVTDYAGNLLTAMTTAFHPQTEDKVNCCLINYLPNFCACICCFHRKCFPESWNSTPRYSTLKSFFSIYICF